MAAWRHRGRLSVWARPELAMGLEAVRGCPGVAWDRVRAGLSGDEAATALDMKPDALRKCLSRARRQLAAILDTALAEL